MSKVIEFTDSITKAEVTLCCYEEEVEIYLGGWFLTSVNIEDISKEAKQQLHPEVESIQGREWKDRVKF